MKWLRPVSPALGALVLALFIFKFGLHPIWMNLKSLKWKFVPILVLCLSYESLNTGAWLTVIGAERRVKFLKLFKAWLAGEAINATIPLMSLGGEPLKAALIRDELPFSRGMASVVIDRTISSLAGILFAMSGVALGFRYLVLPLRLKVAILTITVTGAIFMLFLIFAQLHAPGSSVMRALRKVKLVRRDVKTLAFDEYLSSFYRDYKSRFLLALIMHLSARMIGGILETWIILRFWGINVGFTSAWLIASLTVLIVTLFAFLPSGLGASEGGQAYIFKAMGLDPTVGLSMGIVKRLRKIAWVMIGLIILAGSKSREEHLSGELTAKFPSN